MILRYPLCLFMSVVIAAICYVCAELPYLVYKKRRRAPFAAPEPALVTSAQPL